MNRSFLLACALGAVGLFGLAPRAVAHPCLEGTWTAALPCPGFIAYEFGTPRFVGNGVWEGCLRVVLNGRPISMGEYQVRMWTNTDGTLSIREGEGIGTAVGIIDFKAGTVDYLNTIYRK